LHFKREFSGSQNNTLFLQKNFDKEMSMSPRGNEFGMGMNGLADMISGMMGCDSGTSGIHIDPSALDEYPKRIQDSMRNGDHVYKKQMSPEEVMQKIEQDALDGQLKETKKILHSALLHVEGLRERLAEKDAAAAEAEKERREQVANLRRELRKTKKLVETKANAHDVRLKVVQALRAENKSLKANLQSAADGHIELKELIMSIDFCANKPELIEKIRTLQAKMSGNGADTSADDTTTIPPEKTGADAESKQ
jgi:chromosome segregation ATPase